MPPIKNAAKITDSSSIWCNLPEKIGSGVSILNRGGIYVPRSDCEAVRRGECRSRGDRRNRSVRRNLLHRVVESVGDVDVPACVDGNVLRFAEAVADYRDRSLRRNFLDRVIRRIGNKHVAMYVGRDAHRRGESLTNRRDDSVRSDLANLVVRRIGDVEVFVQSQGEA